MHADVRCLKIFMQMGDLLKFFMSCYIHGKLFLCFSHIMTHDDSNYFIWWYGGGVNIALLSGDVCFWRKWVAVVLRFHAGLFNMIGLNVTHLAFASVYSLF